MSKVEKELRDLQKYLHENIHQMSDSEIKKIMDKIDELWQALQKETK